MFSFLLRISTYILFLLLQYLCRYSVFYFSGNVFTILLVVFIYVFLADLYYVNYAPSRTFGLFSFTYHIFSQTTKCSSDARSVFASRSAGDGVVLKVYK